MVSLKIKRKKKYSRRTNKERNNKTKKKHRRKNRTRKIKLKHKMKGGGRLKWKEENLGQKYDFTFTMENDESFSINNVSVGEALYNESDAAKASSETKSTDGVKINDNIFNQVVASNGGADSLLTRIPNDEDVEMLESNPTAENIVNYVKTISKKTENIMKDEYYIVTIEDTDNNPFIKAIKTNLAGK